MTRCGRVISCLAAAATLSTLTSCYERTPLNVTVLDAETREPIAGARLSAFQVAIEPFGPEPAEGTTGADGCTVLNVVDERHIRLSVKAEGYLHTSSSRDADGTVWIPNGAVWGDGGVTLHALRDPAPTIECSLPQGFRGEFRLITDSEGGELARRDADNIVRLRNYENGAFRVAPGFPHSLGVRVSASYPDGTMLSPTDWQTAHSGAERLWVWPKFAYDYKVSGVGLSCFPMDEFGDFVVASLDDIEKAKRAAAGASEGTAPRSE